MVRLKDDGRVTAKIIDLGLAKGVSEPGTEAAISSLEFLPGHQSLPVRSSSQG